MDSMSKPYVTLLGKAVRHIARLRGGGSALPGLFVEKIDPNFIKRTLAPLPRGVVVVSGTNGKTTTTKMVVELLEGQGMKVFTNRTGSNFTRGVAAALLGEVDSHGRLDADIAVLELDEAHAVHFVKQIPPRYSLLLNVMRDQLDRFGEIDATARLLEKIALQTTDTVILNREDTRVAAIANQLTTQQVRYFGLDQSLLHLFPNDEDMRTTRRTESQVTPEAEVILQSIDGASAEFLIEGALLQTSLQLKGIYNIFNAAAALTLARVVMAEKADPAKLVRTLSTIAPAFGRGETLTVDGQPLELILVKNPGGFRLALSSFAAPGYATMIAVNDNYADGRDMSWLWDVDFDSLATTGVQIVSGVRAYDMALRLDYDQIEVGAVTTDLSAAITEFLKASAGRPKRIFCTYTAMLAIRRELAKVAPVEVIS